MATSSALKVDKQLLQTFWNLAESNEKGITKATETLLLRLEESQKKIGEEIGHDLGYTVKRLVKGLASSRESARQGFSVALCQVLRKFTVVRTEDVLTSIKDNLQLSKRDSKSDTGNISLGRILAYLTLIQSGKLVQESDEDLEDNIEKVTKKLMAIRTKKSYLHQICTNAIVLLVTQISTEQFKTCVWPHIQSDLQTGWDECTPDILHLLTVSTKCHYEAFEKKFLKNHWQTLTIISEKTYPEIWKVLLKTTDMYPVFHVLTTEILQEVKNAKLSVVDFWTYGFELLYRKKENSKGSNMRLSALEIHMLSHVYPFVTTAPDIATVLDDRAIVNLIKIVDGKQKTTNPLFPAAKQAMEGLVKFVKESDNAEMQVLVLKKFTEGNVRRGHESNHIVDLLRQSLNKEGAKLYGDHVIQTFTDRIQTTDSSSIDACVWDVATHVRSLVSMATTFTDHDWQQELLQFLALHSFWTVNKPSSDILHCKKASGAIDDRLRKKFQDNFFKALHSLLQFRSQTAKQSQVHVYIDTVYHVVSYVQILLNNEDSVAMVTPFTDEVKSEWDRVLQVVEGIRSKQDGTETGGNDTDRAFELLLLHNQIQLLQDPKATVSLLQDVVVCYEKKVKSKRRSIKKATEEPGWMEVITEVLLSMMSQGSILARITASNVFSLLSNHFSAASIKMIMDVLVGKKEGEEGMVTFVDEDDDDMDADDDDDDNEDDDDAEQQEGEEKEMKDDEEDNESEEDEDSQSEEEDEIVDEKFKQSVKAALGKAAVGSSDDDNDDDDDDDDEEDLSDSEMFKLDDALAAAFRGMKKGKNKETKENKQQLVAFKLRVTDLVEAVIKSQPAEDIIQELVFPLLKLLLLKDSEKEDKQLGFRASNLCRLLYRKVKVHGCSLDSKERHLNNMKEIIQFSTKVMSPPVLEDVSNMLLLEVRLLLSLELESVGPSPAKTRSQKAYKGSKVTKEQVQTDIHNEVVSIIQEHLSNFLQKKDNKLNPVFFQNILQKYPVLFWPVTDTLMAVQTDDQIKVYCKTHACSMLTVMLNKTSMEHVGEEVWTDFIAQLKETIIKKIQEMSADNFKPGYCKELLTLLNKMITLLPRNEEFFPNSDWIENLESLKKSYGKQIKHLLKSTKAKLEARQTGSISKKKKKKDKKTKKRKLNSENSDVSPEKQLRTAE